MAGSLELVAFLSKAETNNLDTRGCWEWQGPINNCCGYGRYCVENGHKLAHRYSFKQFYGAIPRGEECLPSLRQPPLHQSSPPIFRNAIREPQGCGEQGPYATADFKRSGERQHTAFAG